MTRTLHAALAFLIASIGVLAGPATAQEDTTWYVASGRMKSSDGAWTPIVFTDVTRRELPEAVVRALAKADVTRDWKAAAEVLDTWAAICTWAEVPDRESLLEHMALRRVELYERFGRTHEALVATQGVLIPAGSPLKERFDLRRATPEELALQTRVLSTQYVATNRERLSRQVAASGVNDDEILRVVRAAVESGDRGQILELGSRAVPALRVVTAGTAPQWLGESVDPLAMLLAIDEAAGAEMILEWFDAGGPFWRRRALRGMRNEAVLTDAGTYGRDPQRPSTPVLLESWWPRVLLRFLREPDSTLDTIPLLTDLARGDALDDTLIATIVEMLRADDPKLRNALRKLLEESAGRQGTRRILEVQLDSPNESQRVSAANALVGYVETSVLRAHADSPDPAVRLAVARSFSYRNCVVDLEFDGNGFPYQAAWQTSWGESSDGHIALVETLLSDPEADVRASIAETVIRLGYPVSEDAWLAMAKDPDVRVRALVSKYVSNVPASAAARVFEVLARDTDPQVLERFDSHVLPFVSKAAEVEEARIAEFLPALKARHANTARPMPPTTKSSMRIVLEQMSKVPAGYDMLVAWALEGDADVQRYLADLTLQQIWKARNAKSRQPFDRDELGIRLDDEQLVRIVTELEGESDSTGLKLMDRLPDVRIEDRAPWRRVARDGDQPLWLRVRALSLVAEEGDEALAQEFVAQLGQGDEKFGVVIQPAFARLYESVGIAAAQRLLAAVLKSGMPERLKSDLVRSFHDWSALTPALSEAILTQALVHPPPLSPSNAVDAALREVASRPFAQQGEWFERASRHPSWASTTVGVLADLREPRYRSILVEVLNGANRLEDRSSAISAIGRYLDDESVEILLDAAARFEPGSVRDQCYAELDRIRVHREQRAAWEQRRRAGATKDAAIAEMVTLLDSPDTAIRAQAVRSLATLGAVEELPRVLRLTQDPDPTVRAAAQRALEVLNASTAAPR